MRWSLTCRSSVTSRMQPASTSCRRERVNEYRTRFPGWSLQILRAVLSACAVGGGANLYVLALEQAALRSSGAVHPSRRGQAMAVEHESDRDHFSGYLTTGHEWSGIKELNTPVPRAVYFFLAAAFLFSVGYWVLMPAWPLGVTYTRGLLGMDQRNVVAASLKDAATDRSVWTRRIEAESFAAVQSDPKLMAIVRETGRTLFG